MSAIQKIIILFVYISLISCSSLNGVIEDPPLDEPFNVPVEDIIAVSGLFIDEEDGTKTRHIILVDFNDPSNYKKLDLQGYKGTTPKFSRGKSQLLFNDERVWNSHFECQFVIYDIAENSYTPLYHHNNGTQDPVWGEYPVWFHDNTGFYFLNPQSIYISEYTILNEDYRWFQVNGTTRAMVNEMVGQDTLVVFGYPIPEVNQEHGYYLTDLDGNYIDDVPNPYFDYVNINEIDIKAAYDLDWNPELKLFAYREMHSDL
ncbi:hypothetical protein ACFL6G_03730, partial [candidate division KSB1 bacterium]